jgi:hypothetical protein
MSKLSHRASREEFKAQQKARKRAQKELRRKEAQEELRKPPTATISNCKSRFASTDEERDARQEASFEQLKVFRAQLPGLLKRFSAIPDPRNARTTKHKLAVLLIYGVLSFVLQMASSREATRNMSRPQFWENLKHFFPELEDVPHHDTLKRLLSGMDVSEIENAHIELIRRWIRQKKFRRYLIDNCYPVAIDATQKMTRDCLWNEECLQRTFNKGEKNESTQYYVMVLQANLSFVGGMSIPLMSEFLSYTAGDNGNSKQDCETKAFHRLSARLKEAFPALQILVLLDGLYPNGPVLETCRRNKWQYMIVLKDGTLPNVMREFEALAELEPANRQGRTWGNRRQRFKWINGIEHDYGPNGKKTVRLHVVECRESWQEIAKASSEVVEKTSRHVWISSDPLDRRNLHERCNLGARSRWTIESNFLVEKHHGYQYEHCFSYDWQAMKGYHYLMQLGHLFNIMARYSGRAADIIKETGVRGLIQFVRETLSGPWLNKEWVRAKLAAPYQLRLA